MEDRQELVNFTREWRKFQQDNAEEIDEFKRREGQARRALYRRLVALHPLIIKKFEARGMDAGNIESGGIDTRGCGDNTRATATWLPFRFKDIGRIFELKFTYEDKHSVWIVDEKLSWTDKKPSSLNVCLDSEDEEIAEEFVKRAIKIRKMRLIPDTTDMDPGEEL